VDIGIFEISQNIVLTSEYAMHREIANQNIMLTSEYAMHREIANQNIDAAMSA
jgi:hypothetical protein